MTLNIKNFYLNTLIKRKEYMRMDLNNFPPDVIDHNNLIELVGLDGKVHVEISKGMYGLPITGRIAQDLLEERLSKHEYHQSRYMPGLRTHTLRPICFSLIVDNFGVKYMGKEHADHLVSVLRQHYEVEVDEEGKKCGGIDLDFDYDKRKVPLSMLGYVDKACARFQQKVPKRSQDSPYQHAIPNYGSKIQYTKEEDSSRLLTKEEKTYVQQVIGTFLFYGCAVYSPMLMPLSAIAATQAAHTELTLKRTKQFLDNAASNPAAGITYTASNMVLSVHSNTSYLNETKARSRTGEHFFLSKDNTMPPNNDVIHTVAKIIKSVMPSAAEAKLGALYINARKAVPMSFTLEEMGHPQPRTPI